MALRVADETGTDASEQTHAANQPPSLADSSTLSAFELYVLRELASRCGMVVALDFQDSPMAYTSDHAEAECAPAIQAAAMGALVATAA